MCMYFIHSNMTQFYHFHSHSLLQTTITANKIDTSNAKIWILSFCSFLKMKALKSRLHFITKFVIKSLSQKINSIKFSAIGEDNLSIASGTIGWPGRHMEMLKKEVLTHQSWTCQQQSLGNITTSQRNNHVTAAANASCNPITVQFSRTFFTSLLFINL